MMHGAAPWTLAAFVTCAALVVAMDGCGSRVLGGAPSDQRLAAVASESVTTALEDSVAPLNGFALAGEAVESLTACDNPRLDVSDWQTFTSEVLDVELPPGFEPVGGDQRASWRSPDGYLSAYGISATSPGERGSLSPNECDVYIGGWPARLEISITPSGKAIEAIVQVRGNEHIRIGAGAKSNTRLAQLLRAIRFARVSSSFGASNQ